MGWMDVLIRVFVYFSRKLYRARWKKQSHGKNITEQHRQAAQRPPQSGVHTAQHTSQQPGIGQPAFAFRGMRFTHSAVVSEEQVKKCTTVT